MSAPTLSEAIGSAIWSISRNHVRTRSLVAYRFSNSQTSVPINPS
jgi:hypothetical protein